MREYDVAVEEFYRIIIDKKKEMKISENEMIAILNTISTSIEGVLALKFASHMSQNLKKSKTDDGTN